MAQTKPLAGFLSIPIDDVHPNPDNPRHSMADLDDLADSIRTQGILEPLIVMPHPVKEQQYQLLAGHRRLAAAELASRDSVPCIVRLGKTPAQSLEFALVENGQRCDLDPIDEARAIKALVRTGLKPREVATRIGRSPAHVSKRLSLLELSPSMQQQVKSGQLKASKAVERVRAKRGDTKPWLRAWFGPHHVLASSARFECKNAHEGQKVLLVSGDQACGQCWERVIREHERMPK